MEIENCNPVEGEEAGFGTRFVGVLPDRRGEAGVSSGEAGLEGIFEGEEIGDRIGENDDRVSGEVQTRRREVLEIFFWVGEDLKTIVTRRKD